MTQTPEALAHENEVIEMFKTAFNAAPTVSIEIVKKMSDELLGILKELNNPEYQKILELRKKKDDLVAQQVAAMNDIDMLKLIQVCNEITAVSIQLDRLENAPAATTKSQKPKRQFLINGKVYEWSGFGAPKEISAYLVSQGWDKTSKNAKDEKERILAAIEVK